MDNENRRTKVIMVATVVIAIATCIYVFFSGLQWRTMHSQLQEMQGASDQTKDLIAQTKTLAENAGKQATNTETLANATKDQVSKLKSLVDTANEQSKVMNKQLITMQKQLEASDRPWLKVDFKPIGPLKFSNENTCVTVNVRIMVKNIGRSVATKVRYNYEMVLFRMIDIIQGPLKHQKMLLDKLSSTKPSDLEEGESIFPNEEKAASGNLSAAITEDTIPEETQKPTNIIPVVVGCIEYQFASSPDRHYTCFNYTVVRLDPLKNITRGVIHVGEEVPPENYSFDSQNWGGRFAN